MSAETQEDMLGWVRALSQSASMEADDIINRWTWTLNPKSLHRHSIYLLYWLNSRSLDAVPVFRTSLRWEIMLKPWSSSTQPRFQNETPSLQENWAGCRQNRLYWIKTWWELKWRHQSSEEDMRADQCKWSEMMQNEGPLIRSWWPFLLKCTGPMILSEI